jgi:XTP/dITP diphosphohydrolase
MKTLVFASNSTHKLLEINALLKDHVRVISLAEAGITEELPETAATLEGNAHMKAQRVFELTGMACFADDTGLEVEALGGAPGVYSARFAGPQRSDANNMALLLQKLENAPHRRARFRTVIALLDESGVRFFEGAVVGTIGLEPVGEGGFGYDPLFIPEGASRTFAQMSRDEKNSLSHRGRALAQLTAFLAQRS